LQLFVMTQSWTGDLDVVDQSNDERRSHFADTDAIQPRSSIAARALATARGHAYRTVRSRPAGKTDTTATTAARVMSQTRVGRTTERAAVRSTVVEFGTRHRDCRLARRRTKTLRQTSPQRRTNVLAVSTPDPKQNNHCYKINIIGCIIPVIIMNFFKTLAYTIN